MTNIHVVSASWDGDVGTTTFKFSDGSVGVQHFVGSGLGMRVGNLHTLNQEQHIAVIRWNDRQNVGKGIL
jgi:hypothetical protein